MAVFSWYFDRWWHTILPLAGTVFLLAGSIAAENFLHNSYGILTSCISFFGQVLLILSALLSLATFAAGIVQFCRKRWLQGIVTWGLGIVCIVGFLGVLATVVVAAMFGPSEDHFADNLKLPEGIDLAEPGAMIGGFGGCEDDGWNHAPGNTFQNQVLNAVGKDKKLDGGETGSLPALKKLMSTPAGKARLIQYLACNPEWRLYEERHGVLYATRRFRTSEGKPCSQLHNYYSHFEASTSLQGNGKTAEVPACKTKNYQFRFGIGLDGKSWNRLGSAKPGVESRPGNGVNFSCLTRLNAGDALVEIFDETAFQGRQMTAKALELTEQEFCELKLPPDAALHGKKPDIILFNGFQGGLYNAEVFCNPGEQGRIYLKAYEITKGTRLSESRLEAACNEISGWSNNPDELFYSQMEFTIYEGDWNQFYGARFEVWFKPVSGAPERKLFEKNYKIQGWMR